MEVREETARSQQRPGRTYEQRAHFRETQATARRAGNGARLFLPILALFWAIVIAAIVVLAH